MTSLRDGYATLDPLRSDQRPAAMRTTPQDGPSLVNRVQALCSVGPSHVIKFTCARTSLHEQTARVARVGPRG